MGNPIRGDDSRDRIEGIARGNQTLAELADKYGVNHQTMREWSVRHSDETAARRAELQRDVRAESAHLWVSDKAEILAY